MLADVNPECWEGGFSGIWDNSILDSLIKYTGFRVWKKYQLLISKLALALNCRCALWIFRWYTSVRVLSILISFKLNSLTLPGFKSSMWNMTIGTKSECTLILPDIFQKKKEYWWVEYKQLKLSEPNVSGGSGDPCTAVQRGASLSAGVCCRCHWHTAEQHQNMTCLPVVPYSSGFLPLLKWYLQIVESFC